MLVTIMSLSRGKHWNLSKSALPGLILLLLLGWVSLGATQLQHSTGCLEIYSPEQLSPSMLRIADMLEDRIGDFQMKLGIYPSAKVAIHIITSQTEYQKLSLGKTDIVEFSDAFYSSKDGRIYIRSGDQVEQNYLKILMHEYIHWYLEQLFRNTPLWFHEGMATYHSGQLGYERYLLYIQQSFLGKSANLFRTSYQYPANQDDWPHFYLSSAMALRFMEEKHPQAWQVFWNQVAANHHQEIKISFNQAFISSYGQSLYDFNQNYEKYSRRQGYLYLIVGLNSLIFLVLPFIMLLVARKRRQRMLKLPDLDLAEETDPLTESESRDQEPEL
jgi:hypothetical protein